MVNTFLKDDFKQQKHYKNASDLNSAFLKNSLASLARLL